MFILLFRNIIANLSEEFDEDTNDYPLTMSGAQWKKFRTLFGNFIMVILNLCNSQFVHYFRSLSPKSNRALFLTKASPILYSSY